MPSGGLSMSAIWRRRCEALSSGVETALSTAVLASAARTCCWSAGRAANASRRLANSLGRTDNSAIRVAILSKSGSLLSSVRKACKTEVVCSNSLCACVAPSRQVSAA